ncbi:MAG TPA: alkaline phosphatase family protein [Sphingomicrobium sp.]|nr:alkaline phosphatase family protein [Sphingomicrobium sp.]
MRKCLAFAAAALAGCGSQLDAQARSTLAPAAPRLTIVISVDQLSADLFEAYRPVFTGGLARLARGTVFANGYQGHAATETCPGHATIMTGVYPARSGIVANAWYDEHVSRADKEIYCAEDERINGTNSSDYRLSPVHLKVATLADMLKAGSPRSRVMTVAGKDRTAIMLTGRSADQRWYWKGGRFETDLSGTPARSVAALNRAVGAMIAAAEPGLQPTPACVARATVYKLKGSGREVGNGRFARGGGDMASFRASPALDGATLALAAGLVGEMSLGKGPATDLLAIGLAATDLVAHAYGTGGQEMCLQLLSLDRDLGDFFATLDNAGIDYSVVLTADHGGPDIPERARANGVADADWIDPKLSASNVSKALEAELKLPRIEVVGNYSGDIEIGPNLAAPDRGRAIAAAQKLFAAHPQIEFAFTQTDIARVALPTGAPDRWTLAQRVRASFDPDRSGDLIVVPRRTIMPVGDTRTYANMHGTPWDHDRRVPILFWRRGMAASDRPDAISAVDIMPTLAAWLGVPIGAARIDGRCLDRVEGISCPR